MTLQEVRDKVKEIGRAASARDYERAHCEEDALYLEVLRAVASGDSDSSRMARAAVSTQLFVFPRHCA